MNYYAEDQGDMILLGVQVEVDVMVVVEVEVMVVVEVEVYNSCRVMTFLKEVAWYQDVTVRLLTFNATSVKILDT